MSVDLTPILTAAVTGATGVAGGWLGYRAAKHQGNVELERIRLERDRLERELEEPHRQHRQAVYHDFLDIAFRWHQERARIDPFKSMEDYQQWARDFEHHLNAVSLFGTVDAYKAAQKLAKVIEDSMGDANQERDPKRGYPHEDKYLAAYRDTIEAMRPDTAPSP